jgi:DNA-3-methyladenine glycosylase
MFGPPGFTYVYLVYGMHHCLNLVTEREGYPAAVLVRALEPVDGEEAGLLSGPGRLCRAFEIDRTLNRMDLCGNVIWVEDRGGPAPPVGRSARIGVDYAGPWAKRPWRFFIEGSPAVSRAPRRRAA